MKEHEDPILLRFFWMEPVDLSLLEPIPACVGCENSLVAPCVDDIYTLNCGHIWHESCLQTLGHKKGKCPHCLVDSDQAPIKLFNFTFEEATANQTRIKQEFLSQRQGWIRQASDCSSQIWETESVSSKLRTEVDLLKEQLQTLNDEEALHLATEQEIETNIRKTRHDIHKIKLAIQEQEATREVLVRNHAEEVKIKQADDFCPVNAQETKMASQISKLFEFVRPHSDSSNTAERTRMVLESLFHKTQKLFELAVKNKQAEEQEAILKRDAIQLDERISVLSADEKKIHRLIKALGHENAHLSSAENSDNPGFYSSQDYLMSQEIPHIRAMPYRDSPESEGPASQPSQEAEEAPPQKSRKTDESTQGATAFWANQVIEVADSSDE